MEIKVFNTAAEVAEFVSSQINNKVSTKKDAVLGLATGRTMDAIYHRLVKEALQKNIDYSQVRGFAVDEYIGLVKDSAHSYEKYLNLHLYEHLNFNKENTHIPATRSDDIDQACADYESIIQSVGGIDLQLLGIGLNGHIGLNEPGSCIESRTRVVALSSTTRSSNKVLFRGDNVPLTAVTMGIGTILESKECFLIATGETKSDIVQKVINGDINSQVPATALKTHTNCKVILDKHAAKLI